MYYEVYVDVLFVKNLWMNGLLLLLTVWADQETIKWYRIAAAAVTGSLGVCLLYVASGWLPGFGYILGSVFLAAVMTGIACPVRKHYWGRVCCLYLESFLLNGILAYLGQFHRLSGLWFAIFGSISAMVMMAAEYIWRSRRREKERSFSVLLHHGECRMLVEALYDTGNSLYDPISKKAVSILDGKVLETLLKESGKERFPHMIPYDTIGEHGILEAYVLDGMEFDFGEEKRRILRPMVARMPGNSRQYQLILHRDLLSS